MKKTEIEKDAEFMLKLLHDEWSLSGKTKTNVFLAKKTIGEVIPLFVDATMLMQKFVDSEEVSFKESMMYSKNAFVHLRVIRKLKKAMDKEKSIYAFVPLDKEELTCFEDLVLPLELEYSLVK